MSIEGELVVSVTTAAGRVAAARGRVQRPRVANKLFAGRPARDAGTLAGTLFAICGRSQAVAADAAVETARGEVEPPTLREARDTRVAAETIQEHAWRLLVDWPKLEGRAPQVEALALVRRIIAPLLGGGTGSEGARARSEAEAWAERTIFGMPPQAFLALATVGDFELWVRRGGTTVSALAAHLVGERAMLGASDVGLLPAGGDDWVAGEVEAEVDGDAAFEEAPHWRGEARETGPLARMAGHPLVAATVATWGRGVGARLAARLVELAAALVAVDGRHGARRLEGGAGLSWVETPRGLLLHHVVLEGERIAAYRIVAPTEWNFHPSGAFSRGAVGIRAGNAGRLEQDVRWLVASLDPCVGVRFEAAHA
jgi:Ni,Fe-hydrogenase I large subunit